MWLCTVKVKPPWPDQWLNYPLHDAHTAMEINVFSPGGLGSAQKFTGVNFSRSVIRALERKVQYMEFYQRNFDNSEMATL